MAFNWSKMPVYFDGHDLSSIINITSLDRGVGSSRRNRLLKAGNQKGTVYNNYTYDEKVIPMGFSINLNINKKRRELNKILNVKEPKKLVFGDEPDIYYMAVPDGNISLDEVAQNGKGVIEWIIPDGVGRTESFKEFEASSQAPNEIVVDNEGSEFTKPILEAEMKSENGFVAFFDNRGNVLQIGDPQETDGVDYQVSDKVLNESMITQGKWEVNKGKLNYIAYGEGTGDERKNEITGSWDFTTVKENAIPKYSDEKTLAWNGPSLFQNIKSNSNSKRTGNFDFRTRFDFKNRTPADRGRLEISLLNDDLAKPPFNITIRDSRPNGDDMQVEFWYKGQLLHYAYLRSLGFTTKDAFFEASITRFGNKITYSITRVLGFTSGQPNRGKNLTKSFNLIDSANVEVHSVMLWAGRWRKAEETQMDYTDCKFTWNNVDKWENVPNLFDVGDILTLDTNTGNIFLNGTIRPDLETFGNDWGRFGIEPGTENVFARESTWVKTKPKYRVRFREVWN